jgi:hypothetical protein
MKPDDLLASHPLGVRIVRISAIRPRDIRAAKASHPP